jgi:hypothetical protein
LRKNTYTQYSSQSGGNKTTKFITTRLGSVLDPIALLFSCLTGKLPMAVQSRLLIPESVHFMNTKEACQIPSGSSCHDWPKNDDQEIQDEFGNFHS